MLWVVLLVCVVMPKHEVYLFVCLFFTSFQFQKISEPSGYFKKMEKKENPCKESPLCIWKGWRDKGEMSNPGFEDH